MVFNDNKFANSIQDTKHIVPIYISLPSCFPPNFLLIYLKYVREIIHDMNNFIFLISLLSLSL